eukprot:1302129-Pleurochrysis_carterae.AAC.1
MREAERACGCRGSLVLGPRRRTYIASRRGRTCQPTGHGMRDAARFFASELVDAAVVLMPAVRAEARAAPDEPELGPIL